MYIVRDRETGSAVMAYAYTMDEAKDIVLEFEAEDMKDGTYEQDFYEIVQEEEK